MEGVLNVIDYERAAEAQMKCTYTGDYERGNLESDKLREYNMLITDEFESYRKMVDDILEKGTVNSCIWISNVVKALNYRVDYAIKKLEAIAKDESLGIISFNAEMMLMQLCQTK